MKTLLTIAGFDPSSGAGVTADLMVFAAHGHFGTSAITSLTVQSTLGVRDSHPVSPSLLRATLECLSEDLPPDGIKIGMLATKEVVDIVADYVEQLQRTSSSTVIVLDPVIRSTSGRELLSQDGTSALRTRLLPLVGWVTPNLAELAALTELPVSTRLEMEKAAAFLQSQLPRMSVFATGGHIDPPDDLLLAADDASSHWIRGERIESRSTHGTGCALSSALLCRLVEGLPPLEAAREAKSYVAGAIRSAIPLGSGKGPLNHLTSLRQTVSR